MREVSTNKFMDTNGARRINKRWPEALKREIVAASYAPGASVATVARQYGVNANQVFNWRRRFVSSNGTAQPSPPQARPRLVPVTISVEPETSAAATSESTADDAIEIEVADTYRVRVRAGFDCRTLRRILDCLVRR
jgi:transposase